MTITRVGGGLVAALVLCSCQRTVQVSDLHADFREIWKGYENSETGKEVRPDARVTIEFSAKPKTGLVVGSYHPTEKFAKPSERDRVEAWSCGDDVSAVRSTADPPAGNAVSAAYTVGAQRPNALTLAASRPLVEGCGYEFRISSDVPLTDDGARLEHPLSVRFRVGKGYLLRELNRVGLQLESNSRFSVRAGVNTPVADALVRYQSLLKVRGADLKPDSASAGASTFYHQYAHGYRVDDEGYLITSEAGMLRTVEGHVLANVPAPAPPKLDSAAALRVALAYLNVAEPPWSQPPRGDLYLRAKGGSSPPSTRLVWGFGAAKGLGVVNLEFVTVDATSGAVVDVPSSPVIIE